MKNLKGYWRNFINRYRRWMRRMILLVRITLRHLMYLNKPHSLLPACIYFYLAGCLFFLAFAKFEILQWKKYYYLWSFTKDFLFIYTIYLIRPKLKSEIGPILFFSVTRILWELASTLLHFNVNSRIVVNHLFYLGLTVTTIHLINRLRKRWNQNY